MELEDLFYYDPSWRIIVCKQCGVVPQTNIARHIRRHHNATRAFKVASIKLFERSLDHLPLIRDADEIYIRRQIWNEAYDKVKDDEPDTVDAYEKILSAQLAAGDADPSADRNPINIIAENAEARQAQMKTLVGQGLDKTEKEARMKEKFNEGLQPVNNVKDFVSIAMKSEPTAAIAWLGITTLIDLVANPLTEPGINRDGVRYVLERVEWYWELAQLLLDPGKVDGSIIRLQSLLRRNVIKLYKKLLLYQMQRDDWQNKVDSIKKAEASLRDDVNQHNSEELKSRLRRIDNTLGRLRLDVKAVESAVQVQTQVLRQIHHDENDQKCLQDLRIVDPEAHKENIEKTKGGLLKDAYYWILDHDDFRRFRNDPESRLLWIKGDPGKGKTMLLCGIINHLKQETSQVLSFYFCQATQSELRSAVSVLRGLLWLLCDRQSQLTSFVRSKYDNQGSKLFEDGYAFESLKRIFLDMLKDPCLREAVFVVDALDECSDDSRKDLIDFILEASRHSSSKWVVSSRNLPSIEVQFQDSENIRVPLELNKDSISQAVMMFIEYKVEQLARKKIYHPKTKDDVRNKLLLKANDTFLWVALVCKELARPEVKARNTIDKLDSIPGGLSELYQRMLEQAFMSEDGDICRKILATECITYRPISLDELRTLVADTKDFSDKELKEVIGECGSFLTLQEDIVYFVHQSAQDFLTDSAKSDIFPSGIQDQHYLIFRRSLDALMTLTRNIYNLEFSGDLCTEISCPKPDPLSHLRYSCLHWVDHLEVIKGNRNQSDDEAISRFIGKRFLYWLEALSLQGQMPQGVKAVQTLKGIITNTAVPGLDSLVEDARRYVLSHGGVIAIAPLQAYASALVFSPEYSRIRELFKKEVPDWIISKPKMEANWDACLQTLEGHDGSVRSVVFSVDGQRLASSSNDKTVKIWDSHSGECLKTLEGHDGWVRSVVFSADGQRLASSSYDNTVKVWDVHSGECLKTLEGHDDWVLSVVFSADGQRLASSSGDKTVKIWDSHSGECLKTLEGHDGWVRSVVFSADGQRLASSSGDNTVKVWDVHSGECLKTLKVNRVLTVDSTNNHCLYTEMGPLKLNLPPLPLATDGQTMPVSRGTSHSGYGISTDNIWILKDRKRVLWLPPEYRSSVSAVEKSTVAIGCRSGRVLVMKFS
ncbi:uncharacterized protein FPOAC1_013708 [Fusarium poae]|uniref:uncharacterized protein n=1 Tax=Fusarium poae TaxID=36050 RepID=UPI001D057048|nr:uncharacterized protein FPOAC1_013708 [Fusarium poae]KAG8664370.1 hypothetical protein FPOAC1_013708 [Fusarium poae]